MANGFEMSNRVLPQLPVNTDADDPQSAEESGMWPQNGPDDPGGYQGQPVPRGPVEGAGGHADRMKKRKRLGPVGMGNVDPATVPGEGVYREDDLD
jgi:hypothetical protein